MPKHLLYTNIEIQTYKHTYLWYSKYSMHGPVFFSTYVLKDAIFLQIKEVVHGENTHKKSFFGGRTTKVRVPPPPRA